jgi:hypothetical protein
MRPNRDRLTADLKISGRAETGQATPVRCFELSFCVFGEQAEAIKLMDVGAWEG